ncbi:MAG: preprotein translocase subunit YajC [Actinomycetota bacterium]
MQQILGPLIFFAVALGIYYALFIFPQQKQSRERREVIAAIQPGDEIVTYGGIFGVVKEVEENWVILTIADGVDIKAAKEAIVMRREPDSGEDKKEAGDGK